MNSQDTYKENEYLLSKVDMLEKENDRLKEHLQKSTVKLVEVCFENKKLKERFKKVMPLFCCYQNCSDGDDNQYPKCTMHCFFRKQMEELEMEGK